MKKVWVAAAALLACAAAVAPLACNPIGTVIRGVTVDGRDAGGMDRQTLAAYMEEKNKRLAVRSLSVVHGPIDETWSFADLDVRIDTAAETERILAIGRSGHILADWLTQWRALLRGEAVDLPLTYDEEALAQRIDALRDEYGTLPDEVRPYISWDGYVSFPEERMYFDIDGEGLARAAEEAILSGRGGVVPIPVRDEKISDFTARERHLVNRVLSQFTTYFAADPNRSGNIARAARSIDGWIVRPGVEFSFNMATGLRTRANGYLDAPVFMDGKLVPDAGGGVCQVSTTLFNAVLLAGLAVTERTCHFSPVGYAPIGQDATVADHYLDFRFVNNLSGPIYLCAVYEPGAITVYVLGNWADAPQKVELEETEKKELPFRTMYQVDPVQGEEKRIEPGRKGFDVTVTRKVTRQDGTEWSDTFRSLYEAVDAVATYRDPVKMEADKKAAELAEQAAREREEREKEKKKAGAAVKGEPVKAESTAMPGIAPQAPTGGNR